MRVVFYPDDWESDIIEVPDDITEDELDEMACDWVANNITGFWKVVDKYGRTEKYSWEMEEEEEEEE